MSHVANLPTSGPLLIFSPGEQQGLCCQTAHLWAIANFLPRYEVLGTPPTARVM